MDLSTLSEETLKYAIKERYFKDFVFKAEWIDFQVYAPKEQLPRPLLWVEAKAGIYEPKKALTQLVLTLLKHPQACLPPFLGAFDACRFSVVETKELKDLLSELSSKSYAFAPSNTQSSEFQEVYRLLSPLLDQHLISFEFETQEQELKNFIISLQHIPQPQIPINQDNFVHVYHAWIEKVKPTIRIDWKVAKKANILDANFYLADLLSENNKTIPGLNTRLVGDHYEFDQEIDNLELFNTKSAVFKDNQEAHKAFWRAYKRPPAEQFRDPIITRRDLLVPPDVRERKGAFYTPLKWAIKSQEYLAHYLGGNFQEEYFIWDCAAGTGNLLTGLSNPYHIFASTLDKNDVAIIKERAKEGRLALKEEHIFQFDFLNDSLDKLPDALQAILNNPKTRSKLLIYINPPYAEAGSKSQIAGTGKNKEGVAKDFQSAQKYAQELGKARNEIFAQFFMRIVKEIAKVEPQSAKQKPPLEGETLQDFLYTKTLSLTASKTQTPALWGQFVLQGLLSSLATRCKALCNARL
ncbi:hypothetical protein [Helicobacter sp. L8]|uniref:hypothetical protein n=1 Tax=Helicobacter sp. L8 TaxID=2316078 RepID=UPI000EB4EFE8|nr:hypothetical protein [Helicobacter sp. L8]